MVASEALRQSRTDLAHGSGAIPTVGFGTLNPDLAATGQSTTIALKVGFRHLDCAERYGNEQAVGDDGTGLSTPHTSEAHCRRSRSPKKRDSIYWLGGRSLPDPDGRYVVDPSRIPLDSPALLAPAGQ
jgi:hypothetical protein